MRALIFFAAISSCIFAQDQAPPAGKFYGPLAAPWKVKLPANPKTPLFKNLVLPTFRVIDQKAPVAKCALPLLEMNLPPASALPMATVAPPPSAAAPGGEAKSLLPPC